MDSMFIAIRFNDELERKPADIQNSLRLEGVPEGTIRVGQIYVMKSEKFNGILTYPEI